MINCCHPFYHLFHEVSVCYVDDCIFHISAPDQVKRHTGPLQTPLMQPLQRKGSLKQLNCSKIQFDCFFFMRYNVCLYYVYT